MEILTHKCTRCGESKPVTKFGKTKETLCGLASWCKPCTNAAGWEAKKRRRALFRLQGWQPSAAALLALGKKSCTKCGQDKALDQFPTGRNRCLECNAQYMAEFHVANREKHLERFRADRNNNPEKVKARKVKRRDVDRVLKLKRYHQNKPAILQRLREKYATDTQARQAKLASNHTYRAAKMSSGSFTQKEWEALCESFGNKCLKCGTSENLTIDHVIPISKGGLNVIENLQPLCFSCNCSKNAKTIDYRPGK